MQRGEFHALVGGNGSGKSTLVKILAGVYQADAGTIEIGFRTHDATSWTSAMAKASGLHFVHQNPGVFPSMSVAENIAIGRGFETGRWGRIRWQRMRERTARLLDRFAIPATPDMPVGALRPADRTMVAIARALQDQEDANEGVLVLDEPTASLPAAEVDLLLQTLKRHAEAGQTIVFVSHRLDEVLGFCDRATVLRDGRRIATERVADLDESRLIELIVGRPLDRVFPEMPALGADEVVLEARELSGGPLGSVSLKLKKGEVLGIAGLLGSGRTELLRMLFGVDRPASGDILVNGQEVQFSGTRDAMQKGIAYVPEDRAADAAFLDMSVRENLSAAQVSTYWRGLWFRHGAERDDAIASIDRFLVKTPSDVPPLATLSGGNQQKVVLARWLRLQPRILLLDEPTQGVDVNARAEIYSLVRDAVAGGASVIVVTSDFEELARVCDRVLVLGSGRVVGEVRAPDIDAGRLTELSYLTMESA